MSRKNMLLILECMSEAKEGKSEGWLLWELMRILGYESRTTLIKIESENHFKKELENVEEQYIHITAHGDYDRKRGTRIKTLTGVESTPVN